MKHVYKYSVYKHTYIYIYTLILLVVVSILCKQCGRQIGGEGEGYSPPSVLGVYR